jgi:phage terminase large subunit-like protein
MSIKEIKEAAEADLVTFISLVAPKQLLGHVHIELCNWWTRSDAKTHQICLLPRDHQKSRMIAYRVAWEVTRKPWLRVLYISSTANLAEKQLRFIKGILTSDIYRRYWPEMINVDEGKREKWTNSEIAVDHPKRHEEAVAESTIFTGGLTTSLTGFHCDIAVLDDCVVYENAYTDGGRSAVASQYSLLSSIETADPFEWIVGTRYHPKDLYGILATTEEEVYNDDGDIIGKEPVYEVFEKQVENQGDGTGEFLWPRQSRGDGRYFGFDRKILSQKRAKYLDKTQFRAQYYNDPNDPDKQRISQDLFQYYDRKFLTRDNGVWYYKDRRLNVFASIDFAFSLSKKADYSAIVVIGIDSENSVYVLDISRFKTEKIKDYFSEILRLHIKWDFRRLRAEVTAAQHAIVKELKSEYIKKNGLALSIDDNRPNKYQGAKEERIAAVLEPRYENHAVWHYEGGNCQILEEELMLDHPPHDDVKDALAAVIETAVAPTGAFYNQKKRVSNIVTHHRFGGSC